jgi:hypothetical protein
MDDLWQCHVIWKTSQINFFHYKSIGKFIDVKNILEMAFSKTLFSIVHHIGLVIAINLFKY